MARTSRQVRNLSDKMEAGQIARELGLSQAVLGRLSTTPGSANPEQVLKTLKLMRDARVKNEREVRRERG